MTRKNHTRTLVISSMLAALIFVFTAFAKVYLNVLLPAVLWLPGNPYINLGDCIIYCAGMLVGAPWAAAAAGIGSAFADLALGAPIYIPATIVIKSLMGFVCAVLLKKTELWKFTLTCALGGAIMVAGYGLYEWAMWGWGYAVAAIPFNLIQWAAGVVGATALYYPVKRIKGAIG